MICTPHQILFIKDNENGRACSRHRTAYIFFWWENVKDKDCMEYPDLEGRVILKLILQRLDGRAWTGLILLMIVMSITFSKHGNGLLSSIKCEKFPDWLVNYRVTQKKGIFEKPNKN